MKAPNSESHPPPRKHIPKIWGPKNRNHAKHPVHRRMNGVSMKGLGRDREYKQMCYLMFTPVTELEQFIFEKCSFNQPPISHPSPLQASNKPSLSSKSTYSETTHWLQQSQTNINHFWKKDTALVKALRQYHFSSNVLEGQTQWKFQKSRILHKVLDVIAMNMESTKRCLDFCDSTPVDQEFWH